MATHAGKNGIVKVGSSAVAEVRSWSLEESVDQLDATAMGATYKAYKTGIPVWSGSFACLADDTDTTGQEAISIGAEIALKLYADGDASGDEEFSGNVVITSLSRSVSHDGLYELNVGFSGSGALTKGAVV